ncbi:MAG: LamG domain-containing protein [Gammaproteobacteria bacterium]|nr:LamG domain-containing protein [Gammaproteobacteria bacterium]MCP5200698.1 LamG domain-containing protein [Gammaproteobacteria bacterium]
MEYVTGYCDHLSARAGDTVHFMLSSNRARDAEVHLVRLVHGDEHPGGPGFIEREIEAACNGRVALGYQPTQVGSFLVVDDADACLPGGDSFTLHAFVCATTPGRGRQALLGCYDDHARKGYGLGIDGDGRLCLRLGDGREVAELSADRALVPRVWYFVAATYDAASGAVTLYQEAVVNAYNGHQSRAFPRDDASHVSHTTRLRPATAEGPFLLAGFHAWQHERRMVGGLYNGKIDRAGVHARVLGRDELDAMRDGAPPPAAGLAAYWDPTIGYTDQGIGDTVFDIGPHQLPGRGYNRPVRGMTGYNWNGRNDCYRLAPQEYGGVQYNDDAIIDCRWTPSVTWTIPADFKSGVYALRVRADGIEDHVTVFVRPARPTAKIAMLMPTASYLAYANEHFVLVETPGVEAVTGHTLNLYAWDFLLANHPEWGKSTYDHHDDGAGVCYSSYRRPVMNLRPRHRMAGHSLPWQFPADMSIVAFLELGGFEYDVITDEDLHREGVACLAPYNVVLNGTHSEYYSEAMMDATEDYLAQGGRVMYLGANGYYWVVSFRDGEPWCMEVRKLDSGSRAWQAEPGEHYMATNGERSGLWRNRGRPPQKLTGVGFASEGMDECKPYERLPDSYDPACAWIFEGVAGERFGDQGLALGGAAGLEVDRYDLALGTPPGTYLLATSEPFSDNYPHVAEEIMFNLPGTGGTQDFQVRADMTYAATLNGGAVFSTGSIAWGQALPWNGCDNDVAVITANVLRRFAADGPLR